MPKRNERRRGGVLRWRTIIPKPGHYIHIGVTRRKGPRGGKTVAGKVHRRKT